MYYSTMVKSPSHDDRIEKSEVDQIVERAVEKSRKDKDVLAVMLFGSYARGEVAEDVDLCLVLYPEKASKGFEKRIEYSFCDKLDIQVFQDLPLYIRKRVLKEGKILHYKDEEILYDIAIRTVKEFELFRPKYELYLGIAHGGEHG